MIVSFTNSQTALWNLPFHTGAAGPTESLARRPTG
jgi:hypothetical protein